MAHCRICGRKLTNPDSVIRGIGPVCWANLKNHFQVTKRMDEKELKETIVKYRRKVKPKTKQKKKVKTLLQFFKTKEEVRG